MSELVLDVLSIAAVQVTLGASIMAAGFYIFRKGSPDE